MPEELELHDIQGLVARGYGGLPEAAYLLFQVSRAVEARAMLLRLAADVTTAERAPAETATNVALTGPGLGALSGDADLVAAFSPQFSGSMASAHKSRFLGDVGDDSPSRWAWGGPSSDEVHVLLLAYGADPALLTRHCGALVAAAQAGGLRRLHELRTVTLTPTEGFGFRDGISQPLLDGLGAGRPGEATVRSGEFVLGYRNEYDQYAERPILPAGADPDDILRRDQAGSGGADLGRNGSYLVFRQLRQDVAGFWGFMAEAATDESGRLDERRRDLLAAKMVGRWPSGAPLVLAPRGDDPSLAEANAFGYHASDEKGLACPLGAHVRRTNPRDSLEPSPGTDESLTINNRHRLLRRGRGYANSADEKGLHFLCLNANLARQFEFVQHTWANNPTFNGLHGEDDPVIGPRLEQAGWFTEPAQPVRRRQAGLPKFVSVRGGAYFFLPGIAALRYLARPAQ